jgi:tetratricopeptide (TPR) repeat protein
MRHSFESKTKPMKKTSALLFLLLIAATSIAQSKKLLGACSVNDLQQAPFASWYNSGLNDYKPNSEVINQLKKLSTKKFTFKVFFGTWCGDSRRELPRMSKVFNELSIPEKNIQWIAVDDSSTFYKQSPQREEKGLNIFRVPTFIAYEKNVEIGRIVEFPVETLERDLLKILSHQPYESNYRTFPSIISWLQNGILNDANTSMRGLTEKLHSKVIREGELNACGYVLLAQGKTREAITIFQINTSLFPSSANCFDSLGEAYSMTGQKEKSIQAYERAQVLDPKNENVKAQLTKLKGG